MYRGDSGNWLAVLGDDNSFLWQILQQREALAAEFGNAKVSHSLSVHRSVRSIPWINCGRWYRPLGWTFRRMPERQQRLHRRQGPVSAGRRQLRHRIRKVLKIRQGDGGQGLSRPRAQPRHIGGMSPLGVRTPPVQPDPDQLAVTVRLWSRYNHRGRSGNCSRVVQNSRVHPEHQILANPLLKECFQLPRTVYDGDDLYGCSLRAIGDDVGVYRPEAGARESARSSRWWAIAGVCPKRVNAS